MSSHQLPSSAAPPPPASREALVCAEDFSGLLTVINGYSDLLLSRLDPADPNRPLVEEIRRAGAAAVALVQRLQRELPRVPP